MKKEFIYEKNLIREKEQYSSLPPPFNSFPDCKCLEKNICSFVSNKIGRLAPTTPIFCKNVCAKIGPFRSNFKNEDDFIVKAFLRLHDEEIVEKIINKFSTCPTVIIPENWENIKESLSFLKNNKNFHKILLTGSIILKEYCSNLKDIDIVLQYKDFKTLINEYDEIKNKLPKEIMGKPCDYFFSSVSEIGNEDFFFTYLDPEKKEFFKTRWFDFKIKMDQGIKVIEGEGKIVENIIKEQMKRTNEKNIKMAENI
jgi:hypothetical protein